MCRPNELRKNEYRLELNNQNQYAQLIDFYGEIIMRTSVLNLQTIIDNHFHGKLINYKADIGYDGLERVTCSSPYLESKTVTVTNTDRPIIVSASEGYDGINSVTIVFDIQQETPNN